MAEESIRPVADPRGPHLPCPAPHHSPCPAFLFLFTALRQTPAVVKTADGPSTAAEDEKKPEVPCIVLVCHGESVAASKGILDGSRDISGRGDRLRCDRLEPGGWRQCQCRETRKGSRRESRADNSALPSGAPSPEREAPPAAPFCPFSCGLSVACEARLRRRKRPSCSPTSASRLFCQGKEERMPRACVMPLSLSPSADRSSL